MRTIPTRLGPITVELQNDRTAYVRAGTDDDTAGPLVTRGQPISVRSHWRLTADGWSIPRSYRWIGFHRADAAPMTFVDPTAHMCEAVHGAIADALHEHIGAAELHEAGRVRAEADAHEREETAARFAEVAKQLRAEARALRRGGRAVYLDVPFSNGHRERVRTVEMPNGRRLHPVREAPDLRSSASRYGLSAEQLRDAVEQD